MIVLSASRNLGGRKAELNAASVMDKPFELDALFERLAQTLDETGVPNT